VKAVGSWKFLQERLDADLTTVKTNRLLINSFFHAPSVAYITD